MKRLFLSTLAITYLLCLARAAHAAEPVQIKISVDYPEPVGPELAFALFTAPLTNAPKTQVTPWSTNSFAIIAATNKSGFYSMAVSNSLTGEMGFSADRWINLQLKLNLPVKAERSE